MSRINVYVEKNELTEGGYVVVPVKAFATNFKPDNGKFDTADKVAQMMSYVFDLHEADHERLYLICFGKNRKCNAVLRIATGNEVGAEIDSFEIIAKARRFKARGITLVHNHPSGEPLPSTEDITATRQFKTLADAAGVRLVDHIILGDYGRSYTSMLERGLLNSNVVPIRTEENNRVLRVSDHHAPKFSKEQRAHIRSLIADNFVRCNGNKSMTEMLSLLASEGYPMASGNLYYHAKNI